VAEAWPERNTGTRQAMKADLHDDVPMDHKR
jgi:hypothetical protein